MLYTSEFCFLYCYVSIMICFQSQTLWTVTFDPNAGNQNCLSLRSRAYNHLMDTLSGHISVINVIADDAAGILGRIEVGGGTKDKTARQQNQRQSIHINN